MKTGILGIFVDRESYNEANVRMMTLQQDTDGVTRKALQDEAVKAQDALKDTSRRRTRADQDVRRV
ncbi:hypothetical protein KCP74_10495 [Salmonella enterica subsp. enterica]|nr:hypothetical protein KCP74_10495 [Salmonella enterica subsp. enterica]